MLPGVEAANVWRLRGRGCGHQEGVTHRPTLPVPHVDLGVEGSEVKTVLANILEMR